MNATAQPPSSVLSRASAGERFAGYLRLFRPANLVTSCSDVLAGWAIVGAPDTFLFWRLSASVSLYAGGIVLNDYFDRDLDAAERPERPVPSGLVPTGNAVSIGAILLIGGVLYGLRASASTGFLCVLIAIAALAYDAGFKHRASGPFLMGLCRAVNLTIELAAAPSLLSTVWYLPLLPLLYVCGITILSRGEVWGGDRQRVRVVMVLEAGAILGLVAVSAPTFMRLVTVLPFVAFLVIKVGAPLWNAYRSPQAVQLQRAVYAGIVSLIVVDAALTASYAGLVPGAAILSLAAIAGELSKVCAVT